MVKCFIVPTYLFCNQAKFVKSISQYGLLNFYLEDISDIYYFLTMHYVTKNKILIPN